MALCKADANIGTTTSFQVGDILTTMPPSTIVKNALSATENQGPNIIVLAHVIPFYAFQNFITVLYLVTSKNHSWYLANVTEGSCKIFGTIHGKILTRILTRIFSRVFYENDFKSRKVKCMSECIWFSCLYSLWLVLYVLRIIKRKKQNGQFSLGIRKHGNKMILLWTRI